MLGVFFGINLLALGVSAPANNGVQGVSTAGSTGLGSGVIDLLKKAPTHSPYPSFNNHPVRTLFLLWGNSISLVNHQCSTVLYTWISGEGCAKQ